MFTFSLIQTSHVELFNRFAHSAGPSHLAVVDYLLCINKNKQRNKEMTRVSIQVRMQFLYLSMTAQTNKHTNKQMSCAACGVGERESVKFCGLAGRSCAARAVGDSSRVKFTGLSGGSCAAREAVGEGKSQV